MQPDHASFSSSHSTGQSDFVIIILAIGVITLNVVTGHYSLRRKRRRRLIEQANQAFDLFQEYALTLDDEDNNNDRRDNCNNEEENDADAYQQLELVENHTATSFKVQMKQLKQHDDMKQFV